MINHEISSVNARDAKKVEEDGIPSYIPEVNLSEYDYTLPQKSIALFPMEKRDECKLFQVDKKTEAFTHHKFLGLPEILEKDSLLIANDTKVIQARILLKKTSGGKLEYLLIDCVSPSPDPQLSLKEKGKTIWKVIVGGKNVKAGIVNTIKLEGLILTFTLLEKQGNQGLLQISLEKENGGESDLSIGEVLGKLGKIPLPPYIDRDTVESDKKTYQTVYATVEGSVAAPTAGLHFTESVLSDLEKKRISVEKITLHVGAGTFNPIKNEDISQHLMHSEKFTITTKLIQSILKKIRLNKDIITVGTTTTRTIETLYWIGVKLLLQKDKNKKGSVVNNSEKLNLNSFDSVVISQWEVYLLEKEIEKSGLKILNSDALEEVLFYMYQEEIEIIQAQTQLLILPSYTFRIVKVLITNFHAPKSTLILLVAAFLGKEVWKKYYKTAIEQNYRFLSYGDSSILFLNK